jgi:hypothetical protein
MVMSVARFNTMLRDVGQDVSWRRSSLCPCRDRASGAAVPGCPVCGGRGVTWQAPTAAWAGMTGVKAAREWAAFGLWESGDVVMTVPSDSPFYEAGEFDRCVLLESTEPFQEILVRGENDVIPSPVRSIDRVFWLDPTGAAEIDGSIPAQAADLSLFWFGLYLTWPDGVGQVQVTFPTGAGELPIAWPNDGAAPPVGTQYCVRGRRHPEYFLFKDFPQDRAHYGGLTLPRRTVMRKFDLFGR